jgi:hypothetical protein
MLSQQTGDDRCGERLGVIAAFKMRDKSLEGGKVSLLLAVSPSVQFTWDVRCDGLGKFGYML